jgi:hypothetical protein
VTRGFYPNPIRYEFDRGRQDDALYRVFTSHETGLSRSLCVFTSVHSGHGPSSINCAESIVAAISRKEGLSNDSAFLDLQTHHGYSDLISGEYRLDILKFGADQRVASWTPIECPAKVFETFKQTIGPFLTLDEVINRKRSCYKDYTDEQLAEEREWAIGWQKQLDEQRQDFLRRHRGQLKSPEEVLDMGYRLAPHFTRAEFAPDQVIDATSIVVDLSESHLLGQTGGMTTWRTSLKKPKPYSYWVRKSH